MPITYCVCGESYTRSKRRIGMLLLRQFSTGVRSALRIAARKENFSPEFFGDEVRVDYRPRSGAINAEYERQGFGRDISVEAVPVTPAQFMAIEGREVRSVGFATQEEVEEARARLPHLFADWTRSLRSGDDGGS
jgi:hypothetical protein